MSKQKKAVEQIDNEIKQEIEGSVEKVEEIQQTAETQAEKTRVEAQKTPEQKVVVQKSGGKGIALLALLVALAVGGTGHYMANRKFAEIESGMSAIAAKASQPIPLQTQIEIPNFDAEKVQIATLAENYQKALNRIEQLENQQNAYTRQIGQLQLEVQKLGNVSGTDKTSWLLSDADFLLSAAARKVMLDNDIDTAKNLLNEADQVLAKVPSAMYVREAIRADLNLLMNIEKVDQEALMQRIVNLTNKLDDLPAFDSESSLATSNAQVTDSLDDWQSNLEKSANSFLDRFIRVSDRRSGEDEKVFVAPNQEIYLRENIRLRLQLAILAVSRQQSDLYKMSLQTVGSWIRSYFDTTNENVKNFLKEIDDLADETVYQDIPTSLQSLNILKQQVNRISQGSENVEKKSEQAESEKVEAPSKPEIAEPSAQ